MVGEEEGVRDGRRRKGRVGERRDSAGGEKRHPTLCMFITM